MCSCTQKMAATCGVLSAQDVPPEGLQCQKPLELRFKRNCCQKMYEINGIASCMTMAPHPVCTSGTRRKVSALSVAAAPCHAHTAYINSFAFVGHASSKNRGLPPLLCIAVPFFQRNPCTGRNLSDPGLNALVGTSVQQKTYDINVTCELRLHAERRPPAVCFQHRTFHQKACSGRSLLNSGLNGIVARKCTKSTASPATYEQKHHIRFALRAEDGKCQRCQWQLHHAMPTQRI